jgi:hypothetical protein
MQDTHLFLEMKRMRKKHNRKQKLPTSAGFEPNAFYERERIEHNHASRYLQIAGESGRARCLILRLQTPARPPLQTGETEMDYLTDPETRKHFDEIRRINERARRAKEERDERLRAELAADAAQRAEEQQRLLAARLECDLRSAFFDANPAAVESDWNRLKDSIRDEHMRRTAAQNTADVFNRIRSEAEKRRQEELDRRARFEQLPERA